MYLSFDVRAAGWTLKIIVRRACHRLDPEDHCPTGVPLASPYSPLSGGPRGYQYALYGSPSHWRSQLSHVATDSGSA